MCALRRCIASARYAANSAPRVTLGLLRLSYRFSSFGSSQWALVRRGCGCAVFPSPCLCHVGSLEPVRLESVEEEQEQSSVQVPKKVLGDSMSTIIRLAQGPIGRMIFPSARLEGDIPEHGREHLAVDLHSFREIMCQP